MTEIKRNEIVKKDRNIITPEQEYQITALEPEDVKAKKSRTIIPVSKEMVSDLSVVMQNTPMLAANIENYKQLGKTAYSITFNGENVLPGELWQKKNGYFISNLKGEGGKWGKQADISVLDNSAAQAATVASSVFAVAAVATSMYYMKNINDKLADVQKSIKQILHFLQNNKQSQVEADLEILNEIASNMHEIKSNETLKQIKVEQFSSLQRDAKSNVRFYEKEIRDSLEKYIDSKRSKQGEALSILKCNYYYYRVCMFEYGISKLIEIELTDAYSKPHLSQARSEIRNMVDRYKSLNSELRTQLYQYRTSTVEAKALDAVSTSLDFLSGVVKVTPLSRTDLDDSLKKLGKKSGGVVKKNTKKLVNKLQPRDDYHMMNTLEKNILMIEKTYHKPLELVRDGDEAFICVSA